jgi:adenylate cyclase
MSRRERTRLLVGLAMALGIGLLLSICYMPPLRLALTYQQSTQDIFVSNRERKSSNPADYGPIPSRYVIIALDSKTIAVLGRWSSWDRSYYARVIDKLREADASVVVFDIGFFEPAPGDDELARALRDAATPPSILKVVQPVIGSPSESGARGPTRLDRIEQPLPSLREAAPIVGSANVIADLDGTVRTIPLLFNADGRYVPALSLAGIAQALSQIQNLDIDQQPPEFRFAGRKIPITDRYGMRINYVGPPSFPDGPQTFKTVSFVDVLEGKVDPGIFREKRVFVGLLGAQGFADDYWTPVSTTVSGKMAGVEIHANAAATVEREAFFIPEDPALTVGTILLLAVVAGLAPTLLGIVKGLGAVIVLTASYFVFASQMFTGGRLVNILYPLLALALSYAGTATYSVIFEQRHARFLRGAMGRYLSPAVMEEIVRRPELLRLGGEKREMTVLFSDIRGFTTFSEQLDPQELVTLLNEYLTAMTDVVYRYDGVLDKYMGDAIMAFWNGPVPQSDHARRACLTALDMLETLHALHDRWRERGIPRLDMGIGLNSGAMSVGNMGSDTRFDYTVMGDAVNLGSRLEGTNKEYHTNIVISQFTLDEVKEEGFVVRMLDLVAVKGKAQPVAVYELIGRPGQFGRFTPELLAAYERGIQLYRAQEFEDAAVVFSEVLEHVPNDGPCMMYLERCQDLVAAPPPQDWDGVYVMTHK